MWATLPAKCREPKAEAGTDRHRQAQAGNCAHIMIIEYKLNERTYSIYKQGQRNTQMDVMMDFHVHVVLSSFDF